MLTVEKLPKNHRRVYEALRDASRALSPHEVADITGLGGSTVRGTVRAMERKGHLRRIGYGLYVVVSLGDVSQNRASGAGVLPVKPPTAETSSGDIAGKMGTDYSGYVSRRVITITIDPEDDVKQAGRWVIPMLEDADEVVVQGNDVTRAKAATDEGQRYRWRLIFEPIDPKHKQKPPGPAPN